MSWVPISLAILIGMMFSQQPVINAAVARVLGSPVQAAFLSVFITLLGLGALLPFTGGTLKASVLITLPWWTILGGLIGVALVGGAAYLAPTLGAAVLFVCLVAGQLLGASMADYFGVFGLPHRELSATRVAGLVLVLVGALLVSRG